jgi:4-hydroxy-tetrahydrodipicolinate synthase
MTVINEIYGSMVAIVTPFNKDESVDLDTFKKLVEWHIESGTQGIVVLGTTGEAATLTDDEDELLVKTALETSDGRVAVIAGASCNCTKEAVRLVERAKSFGVDGVLVLTPYYNKPPQEGIYMHFKALNEVGIPLIVYNCPGRTASNVEATTMLRIANELENVVACKEASGDLDQIKEVLANRPDGFAVFSGDDSICFELLPEGLNGCISVVANEFPAEFQEMFTAFKDGNLERAQEIQNSLSQIMDQNFIETNPIPVKTALELMGKIPEATFRLPLLKIQPKNKKILQETLNAI